MIYSFIWQTALIEGCYYLFKAILSDQIHGNNMFASLSWPLFVVSDDKVFEFSDYIWGLLIHMSKVCHSLNFSQTLSFMVKARFQTFSKFIIRLILHVWIILIMLIYMYIGNKWSWLCWIQSSVSCVSIIREEDTNTSSCS